MTRRAKSLVHITSLPLVRIWPTPSPHSGDVIYEWNGSLAFDMAEYDSDGSGGAISDGTTRLHL